MNDEKKSVSNESALGISRPLRVLCAEDDPNVAMMLTLAIRQGGHFAESVGDGADALEHIGENKGGFDLVITDHHMPTVSGLQLVRRLRAGKFAGRIVVHSSKLPDAEQNIYRTLGVEDFLVKPVDLSNLMGLLRRFAAKAEFTDEELFETVMRGQESEWEKIYETCRDRKRAEGLVRLLVERTSIEDEQAVSWVNVLQEMHPGLPANLSPRRQG